MRWLNHMARCTLLGAALLAVGGCGDDDDDGPTGPNGPQPFLGCSRVVSVAAGTGVSGELTTADCQWTDDSYVDYYELRLTAQRDITITMSSTSFDAVLILYDRATGEAIAGSDDPVDERAVEQITRRLAAGTYVIAANAFDVGEVGEYTLTVAAQ
jgi:hypothetical protein